MPYVVCDMQESLTATVSRHQLLSLMIKLCRSPIGGHDAVITTRVVEAAAVCLGAFAHNDAAEAIRTRASDVGVVRGTVLRCAVRR